MWPARSRCGLAASTDRPSAKNCRNGELARGIYETAAREGWKIEELHTEEGRLDEVFRSITMPDTVQEDRK